MVSETKVDSGIAAARNGPDAMRTFTSSRGRYTTHVDEFGKDAGIYAASHGLKGIYTFLGGGGRFADRLDNDNHSAVWHAARSGSTLEECADAAQAVATAIASQSNATLEAAFSRASVQIARKCKLEPNEEILVEEMIRNQVWPQKQRSLVP
jgi:hypothetical protein